MARVEEVCPTSAQELLNRIRPGSETVLWRGVSDAEFKLTPSALRNKKTWLYSHGNGWVSAPLLTPAEQVSAEAETLWQWLLRCDQNGLPIPGDGQTARLDLSDYRQAERLLADSRTVEMGEAEGVDPPVNKEKALADKRKVEQWPPPQLWSLLALAQHHGVPTRLLDFAYDPFVAAFFMAQGAEGAKRMALWGIPDRAITVQGQMEPFPLIRDQRLQVVSVPNFGNVRQVAQKACYLLDSKPNGLPFDLLDAIPPGQKIVKFILPSTEAPSLLKELKSFGYTHNRLFPGYEEAWRDLAMTREEFKALAAKPR